MQRSKVRAEILLDLLACWILGYIGLFVAAAVLPGVDGLAALAGSLVWPWIAGVAILGWLYLVGR